MFERHVAELLRSYLGAYVEGLDTESLNVRVWKGTSQRVAVAVACLQGPVTQQSAAPPARP